MKEKVRFLGLDVHAETIAVAIAEPDGEIRSLGTIANRAESIRKLVKKLGPVEQLKACYEAGPTGYVVYWQSIFDSHIHIATSCKVARRGEPHDFEVLVKNRIDNAAGTATAE